MKLIPLSDFVLENLNPENFGSSDVKKVIAYTKFLKQPLALGMFVPVNEHGVVLEPLQFCCSSSDCGCMGMPVNVSCQEEIHEYYEAKEKVLFEGFEYLDRENFFYVLNEEFLIRLDPSDFKNKTIESISGNEIELTPSSLEAIGIKE